ncbi:MAG: DCC1-like thiol-disulfide oxidoreductase family protein [Alphaproteobacteria bacterium]
MTSNTLDKVEILYDAECPVCAGYCERIKQDNIALVDARQAGPLLEEITRLGLDIDEGMVVKKDGQIFYGSEAMREIVKVKQASRIERLLFGAKPVAAAVYAFCKSVRNVVLWLLAIDKIENLK